MEICALTKAEQLQPSVECYTAVIDSQSHNDVWSARFIMGKGETDYSMRMNRKIVQKDAKQKWILFTCCYVYHCYMLFISLSFAWFVSLSLFVQLYVTMCPLQWLVYRLLLSRFGR